VSTVRIYFASDVHASDRCWKKFLSAPKFYGATVAIMGGDITGKVIVPLLRQHDGTTRATFNGIQRTAETDSELAQLRAQIADSGAYAYETTQEEYTALASIEDHMQSQFKDLALAQVERWVEMAEDRLAGSGVRCLVNGGNDDVFEVDGILRGSDFIEVPDRNTIELADGVQIIGLGYANETPWHCARDVSESELATMIADLAQQLSDPGRAIFDFHVPPYGSGLDSAPKLDEQFRMVLGAHGPVMTPVGSTAVRDALLVYSPMLALHGHVHESRGVTKLGSTTALNPGSEYREGVLRGALIDLDTSTGVRSVQLVSG